MKKKKDVFYIGIIAAVITVSVLCSMFLNSCSETLAKKIYNNRIDTIEQSRPDKESD